MAIWPLGSAKTPRDRKVGLPPALNVMAASDQDRRFLRPARADVVPLPGVQRTATVEEWRSTPPVKVTAVVFARSNSALPLASGTAKPLESAPRTTTRESAGVVATGSPFTSFSS